MCMTKTMKCFEIGVLVDVPLQLEGTVVLCKEWCQTSFGAISLLSVPLFKDWVNEILKFEVIDVFYTDFKVFANFVVLCD